MCISQRSSNRPMRLNYLFLTGIFPRRLPSLMISKLYKASCTSIGEMAMHSILEDSSHRLKTPFIID